jgi:hypothetical protein
MVCEDQQGGGFLSSPAVTSSRMFSGPQKSCLLIMLLVLPHKNKEIFEFLKSKGAKGCIWGKPVLFSSSVESVNRFQVSLHVLWLTDSIVPLQWVCICKRHLVR